MSRPELQIGTPERLGRSDPEEDRLLGDLLTRVRTAAQRAELFEGATIVAFSTRLISPALRALRAWSSASGVELVALSISALRGELAVIAALDGRPAGDLPAELTDAVIVHDVGAGVTLSASPNYACVTVVVPEQVGALAKYARAFASSHINIVQLSTWVSGRNGAGQEPPDRACVLRFDLDLPQDMELDDLRTVVLGLADVGALHHELSQEPQPEPSAFRIRTGDDRSHALTVIGADRPGIVAIVSEALAGARMNVESSSQIVMAGSSILTMLISGSESGMDDAKSQISSNAPELSLCVDGHTNGVPAPAAPDADLWWASETADGEVDLLELLPTVIDGFSANIVRLKSAVRRGKTSVAIQFAVPKERSVRGLLEILDQEGIHTLLPGEPDASVWRDARLI